MMNSQDPTQSLLIKQRLIKAELLDSSGSAMHNSTDRSSATRFSGKKVKIALLSSLPFLLAGLLRYVTSYFLSPGLTLDLASLGWLTAGTVSSAALHKALSARNTKASPPFPFINRPSLYDCCGAITNTVSANQIFRKLPSRKFPQGNQRPLVPEQRPDTTVAYQQRNPQPEPIQPHLPTRQANSRSALRLTPDKEIIHNPMHRPLPDTKNEVLTSTIRLDTHTTTPSLPTIKELPEKFTTISNEDELITAAELPEFLDVIPQKPPTKNPLIIPSAPMESLRAKGSDLNSLNENRIQLRSAATVLPTATQRPVYLEVKFNRVGNTIRILFGNNSHTFLDSGSQQRQILKIEDITPPGDIDSTSALVPVAGNFRNLRFSLLSGNNTSSLFSTTAEFALSITGDQFAALIHQGRHCGHHTFIIQQKPQALTEPHHPPLATNKLPFNYLSGFRHPQLVEGEHYQPSISSVQTVFEISEFQKQGSYSGTTSEESSKDATIQLEKKMIPAIRTDEDDDDDMDDVISLASDISLDLSSDEDALSDVENEQLEQPGTHYLPYGHIPSSPSLSSDYPLFPLSTDELAPTPEEKAFDDSKRILYTRAQQELDELHRQGKDKTNGNEIISQIFQYLKAIQKHFQPQAFSLQSPPADAIRHRMYSQLVDLSANYLILTTQAHEGADQTKRKFRRKARLGESAEFLWQTQQAWKSANLVLINNQVAAMLGTGMMTPGQKSFVFEVCLNLQILSLEEIRSNITQLRNRQSELSDRLKDVTPGSKEHLTLSHSLVNIQHKLARFEEQYTDLKLKESSGMKSQKDFLDDCYSQLTHANEKKVSQGVERYLKKYQPGNIKKIKKLSETVRAASAPMLRRKAKEYAKETSRLNANKKLGIKWQDVKAERVNTLEHAITQLIDAEVLHQLFHQQNVTYTEKSLPDIDSQGHFRTLAEAEKKDLLTDQARAMVTHQVQSDMQRGTFTCHLKRADNTHLLFCHNDYLEEKSQLEATGHNGTKLSETDLIEESSSRVLGRLTTALCGLLQEAGVEQGPRMEYLVTALLAQCHQGAYALHQGISEVIQSKLSKDLDDYLPQIPEHGDSMPPRFIFPDQASRLSNTSIEIVRNKQGKSILLLSKSFQWNISLYHRDLSSILGATRRLSIETRCTVDLDDNSVKIQSINSREVPTDKKV